MSRENRMLLMYFVGVVLLFTYFRIQFPNIGRVDDGARSRRAPEISVLVADSLSPEVEKVARSYELEFGVRVILSSDAAAGEELEDPDLFVGGAEPLWSENDGVECTIEYPAWRPDEASESDAEFRLGICSHSDARRHGAARFGRYLVAQDRGLPLLLKEQEPDAGGDLWSDDPVAIVVVWEGILPAVRETLQDFEGMEGITLQVLVGDCALIERKLSAEEHVDGIIGLSGVCQGEELVAGWTELGLGAGQFVFLSSSDSAPVTASDWQPTGETRIGGLRGAQLLLISGRLAESLPGSFLRLLEQGEPGNFVRLGDLVGEIRGNSQQIGFAVSGDYLGAVEGVRIEPCPASLEKPKLRMLLSHESTHQHLLARLGALVAKSAWEL